MTTTKKNVYRVGDTVRIVNPMFVERVGYPLVWPMLMEEFESKLPAVRAAMCDLIVGGTPEDEFKFNRRVSRIAEGETDKTDRDFLKGVCMAACRLRGFGGNERSLHYFKKDAISGDNEHMRGAVYEVTGRRVVKTGTRYPASGGYDGFSGEHDYEPGGLSGERTHVLLTVGYMEIEAANVELVKAAEPMYYVRNTKAVVGNSILWWADGGHGYTCDLGKAWKVPESKAREICAMRRPKEDFMVPAKKAEAVVERHVDSQLFPLHNRRRRAKRKHYVKALVELVSKHPEESCQKS